MTLRLRTNDITWQEVDDAIVVLDLSGSQYFRLNGTGAFLWLALAQGSDRSRLVADLTSEYGVSAEQADRDVGQFLDQLDSAELLLRD